MKKLEIRQYPNAPIYKWGVVMFYENTPVRIGWFHDYESANKYVIELN